MSGSTVYAGGAFTSIGGQARNYIAALDAATGAATAWNPNANDRVHALAVSGSTVYAGGALHQHRGQTRNRIAALDAATGAATAWNPNADGSVGALAVSGSHRLRGRGLHRASAGSRSIRHRGDHRGHRHGHAAGSVRGHDDRRGIELRWRFGDPGRVTAVAVERAPHAEGPWVSIAPELHDEAGVTVALDRSVAVDHTASRAPSTSTGWWCGSRTAARWSSVPYRRTSHSGSRGAT